jgi:hypothetical protein
LKSTRSTNALKRVWRVPSRVDALKREWKKANNAQQVEFVKWLKAGALKRVVKPIADREGHLRPDAVAFLSHWLATRRLKPGRIMEQMGLSWHDWRLAATINRGETLAPEVIPKLIDWLAKEGFR